MQRIVGRRRILVTAIASVGAVTGGGYLAYSAMSGGADFTLDPPRSAPPSTAISALDAPAQARDRNPPSQVGEAVAFKSPNGDGMIEDSLRRSQDVSVSGSMWLGKRSGALDTCLIVSVPSGVGTTCNSRSLVATWGAIPLVSAQEDGSLLLTGVVSDDIVTARLNGTTVPVKGNTFAFSVPRGTRAAIVTVAGPSQELRLNFSSFLPGS